MLLEQKEARKSQESPRGAGHEFQYFTSLTIKAGLTKFEKLKDDMYMTMEQT